MQVGIGVAEGAQVDLVAAPQLLHRTGGAGQVPGKGGQLFRLTFAQLLPVVLQRQRAAALVGLVLEEIQHLATITPKARRYSDRLMRFAYCLMTYSPVAYKFIRSALPLPSRSQIYVRFSDLVAQMKQSLTNVDEVYRLVEDLGKHADHKASPKIVCTLGVDAFAFRLFLRPSAAISELRTKLRPRDIYTLSPILDDKELVRIFEEDEISEENWEEWPDPGESEVSQEKIGELFNIYNSCFIFVLLPLDCDIPCITLHLEPASSGSANERTATILQQLVIYE